MHKAKKPPPQRASTRNKTTAFFNDKFFLFSFFTFVLQSKAPKGRL
jgi:hypothetical protein